MQRQDAVFQLQQDVFLPHRLHTVDIRLVYRVMDKAHVVNPWQQRGAIHLAVRRNAAHAHAAKAHTVVAALASDKHIAVALTARPVVGQRHFQRGVRRFRTRIAKQHLV